MQKNAAPKPKEPEEKDALTRIAEALEIIATRLSGLEKTIREVMP